MVNPAPDLFGPFGASLDALKATTIDFRALLKLLSSVSPQTIFQFKYLSDEKENTYIYTFIVQWIQPLSPLNCQTVKTWAATLPQTP